MIKYIIIIGRVLRLRRKKGKKRRMSALTPYFSHAGLGHLGKGWIVRVTTTWRLPYRAKGLFYPKLKQVVPIFSLLVTVWLTARYWPDASHLPYHNFARGGIKCVFFGTNLRAKSIDERSNLIWHACVPYCNRCIPSSTISWKLVNKKM